MRSTVDSTRRRPPLAVVLLVAAAVAAAAAYVAIGPSDESTRSLGESSSGLAVLDRPASRADRAPDVLAFIELAKGMQAGEADTSEARLLGRHDDGKTVLVANRLGEADGASREFCIYYDTGGFSSSTCGDLRAIERGEVASSGQSYIADESRSEEEIVRDAKAGRVSPPQGADSIPTHFYGLVPNGVARVEVTFSGGIPAARATVKNNYYDASSNHPGASNRNDLIRWFNDDGQIVAQHR